MCLYRVSSLDYGPFQGPCYKGAVLFVWDLKRDPSLENYPCVRVGYSLAHGPESP